MEFQSNKFIVLIQQCGLFIVVCFAIWLLVKFRAFFNSPILWFLIAFVVFILCCGGIVFNILRKPAYYHKTKGNKGEIQYEYFSKGV